MKSGDVTVEFDLFGCPITKIKDRRGRPSYKKTKENQQFVSLLASRGWNHDRIANRIGCDEKTLRKYFSRELNEGREIVEVEMIALTYANARKGNNAAISKVLKWCDESIPTVRKKASVAPKAEKLGKKEQLDKEIDQFPEDWGFLDDQSGTLQ